MSHTQPALYFPPPTATPTNPNTTSLLSHQQRYHHQQGCHAELPLPPPTHHGIGPAHRAVLQAWLQEHETDIDGLLFIFTFLLILGGLWRSRHDLVQWYFERREKARTAWVERERERRRRVVVVGILRKGKCGGRGEGKVGKRVRFLAGLD
ncbi:hypothetical protein DL95DRAFT_384922, partial [Leptodontidium sp. 2 PMI_412]